MCGFTVPSPPCTVSTGKKELELCPEHGFGVKTGVNVQSTWGKFQEQEKINSFGKQMRF